MLPFSRPEKCLSPNLAALKLRLGGFKPPLTCLAAWLHKGDRAQLAALFELACELLNHSGSLEKFIQPEKVSLLQQQKPRKRLFAQAMKFNLCRASVQQRAAAFVLTTENEL